MVSTCGRLAGYSRGLPWERSFPEAATTSEPLPNAMFTIASSSGSREFEPRLRLMTPVPRRRAVSMPARTPDTEMPGPVGLASQICSAAWG
jgi:hypothetical protein